MRRNSHGWSGRLLALVAGILLPAAAVGAGSAATAPADLEALVVGYRAMGLPMPPPDAPLVRFPGGTASSGGGTSHTIYQLGFLIKPAAAGQNAVVLIGTENYPWTSSGEELQRVTPQDVKPDEIESALRATFAVNAALAAAIQCKQRGWEALSQQLLARGLDYDDDDHYASYHEPRDVPPEVALAFLAMSHWYNQLIEPGTDRREIARRMTALMAAEPAVNSKYNQALLRSLNAALAPTHSSAGSVSAMIDDLVELADVPSRGWSGHSLAYETLAVRGFDAAPALIDHLNDGRLTRSIKQGFNNFPSWHKRVGDIVSDLLQDIAGDELGKDWLDRQRGDRLDQQKAKEWWAKAQAMGEEAYAVAHVLPEDPKDDWPKPILLKILAARYPKHLPDLYLQILDRRPSLQSYPVAEAVAASALPLQKKLALFHHAAENSNLEHVRAAYFKLNELDPKAMPPLLVKTLDALPATPVGEYWKCPEAALAHVVMETDDAEAWAALARAARRADVGLRMEFINPMDYAYIGERQLKRRIAFVAGFLDDATLRDMASNPKNFDGPCAGFTIPRLSVQNLAAMELAAMLNLPDEPSPDKDWTDAQWAALRKQARAAAEGKMNQASTQPASAPVATPAP